jgi:uncharacterized protein
VIRFLPSSVAFAICLTTLSYSLALEVPPLTGRIVDLAHLLTADVQTSLSDDLAEHERKTGNQIAVLTLPSLEGEPLEEYSHRVATAWKLGQKGSDNGVLLLVVPRERRLRIEVGYGLEGKLTDAHTSRIIRNIIVPHFKTGDFAGGIAEGLKAIVGTLEGTEPLPTRPPNTERETDHAWNVLLIAVILGAFIGLMVGRPLRTLGGVLGGALSFFLGMPAGLRLAMLAGGIGMIAAFLFAAFAGVNRRVPRGWNGGWGSGWGGGYGGGFPSSSDTFSGGGGDFGGGGASGRW